MFMTQTAERPPRFSIQVNSRARVTRDYAYFIENRLRERYRLEGVPVIIDFVERNERRARASARRLSITRVCQLSATGQVVIAARVRPPVVKRRTGREEVLH